MPSRLPGDGVGCRNAHGDFRLATRLVDQIERILEINEFTTATKEVVEAVTSTTFGWAVS